MYSESDLQIDLTSRKINFQKVYFIIKGIVGFGDQPAPSSASILKPVYPFSDVKILRNKKFIGIFSVGGTWLKLGLEKLFPGQHSGTPRTLMTLKPCVTFVVRASSTLTLTMLHLQKKFQKKFHFIFGPRVKDELISFSFCVQNQHLQFHNVNSEISDFSELYSF